MEILNYKASEIIRDEVLLDKLCKAYKELFNETLQTSCENCIADGLYKIKYHIRNKKNTKMSKTTECNFRLKENEVLTVQAWGMHISNANLTDELAINILKISKKMLTRFTKVPDNVDELCGWVEAKAPPKVKSSLENVPSMETLTGMLKPDLMKLVREYPSRIAFKESDTKEVIAQAYIDRLILDSE